MSSYMKCDTCGIRFSYMDGHSCNGRNEKPTYSELESRVRELESEVHRARTDSRYWDEFNTISRHDAIRNENDKLKAERDRLKHTAKELGDSFDRGIDREDALRIENNNLRARHAALVDAASLVLNEIQHTEYCNAIKGPEPETWLVEEDCNCEFKELKSALAEVKGCSL